LQPKKTLHIKRKNSSFDKSKTIYSFDSFDSFCDFCTFVNKSKYKENLSSLSSSSDLYEYNSNYYLILTDINLESKALNFIYPVITEFAHFVDNNLVDNSELFENKISEFGKLIIKNSAITTCTQYFV